MARAMSRAMKSEHVGMTMHCPEVRENRQLSPNLRRITLGCDSLSDFRDDGPDQRFKLLLPRPGQSEPLLPSAENWYPEWQQMPSDVRPVMRTYTIRSARPTAGEVDVDVVTHGETGPGSRWALTARAGDRVGLYGAYAEYEADPAEPHLIVADHTALPAAAAICEQLGPHSTATVLIEITEPEDQIELEHPSGVTVRWLPAVPRRSGAALLSAVRELSEVASEAFGYAWVAAEQATVGAIRRELIKNQRLRTDQIMFMGYWRVNGAIDEN